MGRAFVGRVCVLAWRGRPALFAIWIAIADVVIRAFKNQIPVEISGRSVRYAEAGDVAAKSASTEGVLHDVDVEMHKVIKERDTPNAIKIRKGIERMAAIRI